MSIRYNEDLDPNEGPGFGCFVTQAILFAIILLLIPVGLFTLGWPMWVLVALLVAAMILLFFVSMTSVFLLRVFFADRRRGRGRQTGVAKAPTRVISTDDNLAVWIAIGAVVGVAIGVVIATLTDQRSS